MPTRAEKRRSLWLRLLSFAVVMLVASGCSPGENLTLEQWTLDHEGRQQDIALPTRLNERVGFEPAIYRLRTQVELPPGWRGRELTVSIPYLQAPVELWVDGVRILSRDDGWGDGYRGLQWHRWGLTRELTERGSLELLLKIRHTWQRSAWLDTTPVITTRSDGGMHSLVARFIARVTTILAIGSLVAISLSSLALFAFQRRFVHYGWLSAQTFSICIYLLFLSGLSQGLGPRWESVLVAVSVVAAILCAVEFTHGHFGVPPPPRWIWLGWAVYSLAITTFFAAFNNVDFWGMIALAIITICIVHCLKVYLRVMRDSSSGILGARENFIAMLVLGLTVSPEIFVWSGISDPLGGIRLVSVGLFVYGSIQFITLVQAHLQALRVSEQREKEIMVLNEELRRRLADRSSKLSDALARLSASASAHHAVEIGSLVDERYRVERPLGDGAMGAVYQVVRESDERRFAIKVLKAHSDARIMARLAREAQIASALRHPNIVEILDVDFSSTGFMYLVMEYVDGVSLDKLEKRYGNPGFALEICRQVASGLAAMHRAGFAHRDLKPANILVTLQNGAADLVKISDFGISGIVANETLSSLRDDPEGEAAANTPAGSSSASEHERIHAPEEVTLILGERRSAPNDSHSLTHDGELMGTPAFMAPEMVRKGDVSLYASDIFAFGVVGFLLLTGRMPYDRSALSAFSKGLDWQVELTSQACPALDPALSRVLDACLDVDPGRRPTAEALSRAMATPRTQGPWVRSSFASSPRP